MVERIKPKPKAAPSYSEDEWSEPEQTFIELPKGLRLTVRRKGHQRRYYLGAVQLAYALPNGPEWILGIIDATKRSNTYRFGTEAELHAFLLKALTL